MFLFIHLFICFFSDLTNYTLILFTKKIQDNFLMMAMCIPQPRLLSFQVTYSTGKHDIGILYNRPIICTLELKPSIQEFSKHTLKSTFRNILWLNKIITAIKVLFLVLDIDVIQNGRFFVPKFPFFVWTWFICQPLAWYKSTFLCQINIENHCTEYCSS